MIFSHTLYLYLLIITFSLYAEKEAPRVKRIIKKHKKIFQEKNKLGFNRLSAYTRYKLLLTSYNTAQPKMFSIYLNDWAIKQCTQTNMRDRFIQFSDIKKHLLYMKQFKFPSPLYRAIGRRMADFYLIPFIQKQKNNSMALENVINNLKNIINQSIAIVLIYAYNAYCNNKSILEFPKKSTPGKVLKKLDRDTLNLLGGIFNFKVV